MIYSSRRTPSFMRIPKGLLVARAYRLDINDAALTNPLGHLVPLLPILMSLDEFRGKIVSYADDTAVLFNTTS